MGSLDDGARETLDIVIDASIPGDLVIPTLDHLHQLGDKLEAICVGYLHEHKPQASNDTDATLTE